MSSRTCAAKGDLLALVLYSPFGGANSSRPVKGPVIKGENLAYWLLMAVRGPLRGPHLRASYGPDDRQFRPLARGHIGSAV